MAEIKETSIDILYEKLTCCLFFTDGIPEEIMDAYVEAKEIHKQEIVDAINLPREKRWYNALLYNNSGEQYYNETYGK